MRPTPFVKPTRICEGPCGLADRVDESQVLDALHRRLDKVRRQSSSLLLDDTRALHRLRLAVKTLRYASELVLGLYPPSESTAFYGTLRRAQECLGSARSSLDVDTVLGQPDDSSCSIFAARRAS